MYDLFEDPIFGKKGFFDNFMGGGAFDGRHNIKLMYIRKRAFNVPLKKSHIEDHEHEVNIQLFRFLLSYMVMEKVSNLLRDLNSGLKMMRIGLPRMRKVVKKMLRKLKSRMMKISLKCLY
jgi:hypothetical protein